MAFCGQCGLLLPPKVVTCPRCGAAVVTAVESEGQNPHDSTVISASMEQTEMARYAYTPKPDYMPDPNQFTGYNSQTQRSPQTRQTFGSPPAQNAPVPNYQTPTALPPSPPNYT